MNVLTIVVPESEEMHPHELSIGQMGDLDSYCIRGEDMEEVETSKEGLIVLAHAILAKLQP